MFSAVPLAPPTEPALPVQPYSTGQPMMPTHTAAVAPTGSDSTRKILKVVIAFLVLILLFLVGLVIVLSLG